MGKQYVHSNFVNICETVVGKLCVEANIMNVCERSRQGIYVELTFNVFGKQFNFVNISQTTVHGFAILRLLWANFAWKQTLWTFVNILVESTYSASNTCNSTLRTFVNVSQTTVHLFIILQVVQTYFGIFVIVVTYQLCSCAGMYVTYECSWKDFESSSLHGIHVKLKGMSRDGSQHTTCPQIIHCILYGIIITLSLMNRN